MALTNGWISACDGLLPVDTSLGYRLAAEFALAEAMATIAIALSTRQA